MALSEAHAEQNLPIEHKRPTHSVFSPELGEALINGVSEGKSLKAICREEGLTISSIIGWINGIGSPPGFQERFARARINLAHIWAEGTVDIADRLGETAPDSLQEVARDRVRIDARKWIVGKLLPRVYGDRVMQEITGQVEVSVGVPDTRELAKALLLALSGRSSPAMIEHQVEDIEAVPQVEAPSTPHIEHARARGRPKKPPKARESKGSSLFDTWLKG